MLLLCPINFPQMNDTSNTWFAIVNPHAGKGTALSQWQSASRMLDGAGVSHVESMTDCKLHAMEIAFRAAEDGYRKFIAVGGDGTLHEVLDGVVRSVVNASIEGRELSLSDFYLAVIPIGSGNDWIRSHHVPHDMAAAVRLISEGSFAPQDVVKVSSRPVRSSSSSQSIQVVPCSYMVNIGGVGLDARICERVNREKDHGKNGRLLYVNSLVYNLCHHRASRMLVECDGKTVYEGKVLSIAFGIGKYSGGGMRQTPEAVIDDGLIDVTVIPALSPFKILKEARRLFDGTLWKVKEIVKGKCRSVKVTPLEGPGELVEVDGETVGNIPVSLEVLPQQINVLHGLS